MTVSELSDRMSWREFRDWDEFSSTEPFLSERVDLSGALVSSMIANVNRGRGSKAYTVDEFMIIQNSLRGSNDDSKEEAHLFNTMMQLGGQTNV